MTNLQPKDGLAFQESEATDAKGRKSASAFRTISEVADELDVQQHVLRFWETKFSQIKPLKRGGGRRYYRPEDVALLKRIHELLYTEGYTIKGVQKLLRENGKSVVLSGALLQAVVAPKAEASTLAAPVAESAPAKFTGNPPLSDRQRVILSSMLGDLKELRDMIKGQG